MTINADTKRKFASDLRRGDVVLVEQVSTGQISERTVSSVSRERYVNRTQIAVQFDNGRRDTFDANERVCCSSEP
jgi:hypothetical protein